MNIRMTIEWNEQCGVLVNKMLDFLDQVENYFENKNYGNSISKIFVIIISRENDLKRIQAVLTMI